MLIQAWPTVVYHWEGGDVLAVNVELCRYDGRPLMV